MIVMSVGRASSVHNYVGCPGGRPCLKMGPLSFNNIYYNNNNTKEFYSAITVGSWRFFFLFCFFFVVVTNLHINLFIKLCPLLVGMYCSDCLEQKRVNENPLLARISRGRGPTHPYLCDIKSSFDLFIKPGLNSSLP